MPRPYLTVVGNPRGRARRSSGGIREVRGRGGEGSEVTPGVCATGARGPGQRWRRLWRRKRMRSGTVSRGEERIGERTCEGEENGGRGEREETVAAYTQDRAREVPYSRGSCISTHLLSTSSVSFLRDSRARARTHVHIHTYTHTSRSVSRGGYNSIRARRFTGESVTGRVPGSVCFANDDKLPRSKTPYLC